MIVEKAPQLLHNCGAGTQESGGDGATNDLGSRSRLVIEG